MDVLALLRISCQLLQFYSQQNNAIEKINQLTDSTDNHVSFLIYKLGTLLKHIANKSKTFVIILNLDS